MSDCILNTIISAVDRRCHRLGIDLASVVDLDKYYDRTEWYTVLEFCTNLDTRIDYFVLNDDLDRHGEQHDYMQLLIDDDTTKYMDWLREYAAKNYPCTIDSIDITPLDVIRSNTNSTVETAKFLDRTIVTKKYHCDDMTILHEYIVGKRVNELMKEADIRGFVHTVGYRDEVLYLEYISDSRSFDSMLRIMSREQTESCMLQILFNIYYAFKSIGFIHRDLSAYNILVRMYDSPITVPLMIPCTDDNFTRHELSTDVEVTIIDLGHSSISLPGKQDFRLISYISPHQAYEYTDGDISGVSPANDIMYLLSTMMIWNDTELTVKGLMSGIIRMVYMLYTGIVLDSPTHGHLGQFISDLRCEDCNLHMTSPLLGPLYVKQAILHYYRDCIIDITGLDKE